MVEIERIGSESLLRRVNTSFEGIFGYTEAEVCGEDIHDGLTPRNTEIGRRRDDRGIWRGTSQSSRSPGTRPTDREIS